MTNRTATHRHKCNVFNTLQVDRCQLIIKAAQSIFPFYTFHIKNLPLHFPEESKEKKETSETTTRSNLILLFDGEIIRE